MEGWKCFVKEREQNGFMKEREGRRNVEKEGTNSEMKRPTLKKEKTNEKEAQIATLLGSSSMAVKIYVVSFIVDHIFHGHALLTLLKKTVRGKLSVPMENSPVPETLSPTELAKLKAPPKSSDVEVIAPKELREADGFVFGFPTRFGMMAAQFKAFLDSTGNVWKTQQLAGKPAGIFTCTSSQGGGQETTVLSAIPQLAHHGMIFVPFGMECTSSPDFMNMKELKGGSSYGAATYAGRDPADWLEKFHAFYQGYYMANITKNLK
ncbi:hypothetical protein RJT34_30267 [Clitoria ternatea]|uniref:NAD(P)H dehydrogenase (quinone) n=1 Tax=Clitoria ternatea TaxID=43366 RepID=A0AAN9I770_CLITE